MKISYEFTKKEAAEKFGLSLTPPRSIETFAHRFGAFFISCTDIDPKPTWVDVADQPVAVHRDPACCFIPEDQQASAKRGVDVPGCPLPAKWNVYAESHPPDEVTQACTAHVGDLLSDGCHQVWPTEMIVTPYQVTPSPVQS